jgi:hypothetical protein
VFFGGFACIQSIEAFVQREIFACVCIQETPEISHESLPVCCSASGSSEASCPAGENSRDGGNRSSLAADLDVDDRYGSARGGTGDAQGTGIRGLLLHQTGLNGYNFSPAYNLIRGFGVVAELSGQYKSGANLRDIAVGPQFLYPRGKMMFFAHLLIGEARSLVQVGGPQEDTARAIAFGGGMDYALSPRFALRAIQVDYLHTSLFNTTQNNLRFSTGLVYRWGSIKKTHRTLAPNP